MDNSKGASLKDTIWLPIEPPPVSGQWSQGNADNDWLQAAYSGTKMVSPIDTETRLQRLERGQSITRLGRVITTVPQFKSQTFISQTSANNPFTSNTVSGITFPPGTFPSQVKPPNSSNSNIRIPRDVDNL